MRRLYKIVALVGPSGAGKSALINRFIHSGTNPIYYGVLPCFTTRALRPGEERLPIEVVKAEEARRRSKLFTTARFNVIAGNMYGSERIKIDPALLNMNLIKDLVPEGVEHLKVNYEDLLVVLVHAIGHKPRVGWEELDKVVVEKARDSLHPDVEILLDHTRPGGFESALRCLNRFITDRCPNHFR